MPDNILFSDKVTPDIDFKDKPVVQYDVPVVNNTFVDVCKYIIQMKIDTNDCK